MEYFIAATLVVVALFITFWDIIPKLCGYQTLFDVTASSYMIATFAMTGTVSGLLIAVGGALLVSIAIRIYRYFFGYERLEVAGCDNTTQVAGKLASQGAHWMRSITRGVISGKEIIPPSSMGLKWVKHPGQMF